RMSVRIADAEHGLQAAEARPCLKHEKSVATRRDDVHGVRGPGIVRVLPGERRTERRLDFDPDAPRYPDAGEHAAGRSRAAERFGVRVCLRVRRERAAGVDAILRGYRYPCEHHRGEADPDSTHDPDDTMQVAAQRSRVAELLDELHLSGVIHRVARDTQ